MTESVWCTDEEGGSPGVGQHGPDYLTPDVTLHEAVFIHDTPLQAYPSEAVFIVGSLQCHLSTLDVDGQL